MLEPNSEIFEDLDYICKGSEVGAIVKIGAINSGESGEVPPA